VRALHDTVDDEAQGRRLRLEHGRDGAASPLADHHDDLALAGLILRKAPIPAILPMVGWLLSGIFERSAGGRPAR